MSISSTNLNKGGLSKGAININPEDMLGIYEAALANTPDFVYVIDTNYRFLFANASLLKMWGRTSDNAIGLTFTELGYEQWHADMHIREVDTVIKTKKPLQSEVPFTGTGGRRIYDYIFSPIFDDAGEVVAIAGTTRDITDRKEAEEAKKKSDARWKLALEASEFVGTWDWDLKSGLVVADERFARMYSVDPAAAAEGVPLEEFTKTIHPEDAARIAPKIEQVATYGGNFEEEYRLIQPDGSVRWVVARGRDHLDENGTPIRFAGAVVNITERKLAEESLREKEYQLKLLTDALPQQVWTARADGNLDYVNAFTYNYTGDIPMNDGILDWTSVVHPDDLPNSIKIWTQSLVAGEPYETEQRIKHKDSGKYRWNLSRAVPVRNADGSIIKWFGTNTDIEDQKAAAEATIEAREHLRLMVESARDYAIISIDPMGLIISWNHGAELVFGYLPEEIIGKNIDIIFTAEDREHGAPQYELETARTKGRAKDERWHLRKNGERFYVSGTMAAMHDNQGTVKGFIKIARDMTRDQEAQEALIEARNAAEAANIAKTEFLANMSHEIRTPMNAVIGLANILAISQPLTQRQQEFVKTLQLSADSLLALINDMLDIAKIEARTVDLEKVPFSLAQLVQEVNSMMAVRVKEKGLRLETDTECIQNRFFIGDPTRLRQIILNLCSNAIKFTDQGSVTVNITCTAVDDRTENVCIHIKDTGIGIAQEKLETIFHKFVQADTTINRKYGGTGLGLAITKTLTDIMGGKLTVESELGAGSTFSVCIPMELATDIEIQQSSRDLADILEKFEAVKTTGPRILLVEDYAPNILVATTFIEEFGYACDVATNGQEAIEKAKATRYALILMDVQMHGMNGLEATHLIRAYEQQLKLPRVPIIGMTAHALSGDRERCVAAGMDDYIPKPFNPDELRSMIDNAVLGKAV